MQLAKLNFSEKFDFKITKSKSNEYLIYDKIRKKNLVLTPEEWVRQHFIHFLLLQGISPSQIIVEKQFPVLATQKRIDILVLKKNIPQILIELKAPDIPLSEAHFQQIARYNHHFKLDYLLISNGLQHIALQKNKEGDFQTLAHWQDLFGRVFAQE